MLVATFGVADLAAVGVGAVGVGVDGGVGVAARPEGLGVGLDPLGGCAELPSSSSSLAIPSTDDSA